AGDCATLRDRPETPKAGVHAVRQGPLLWRNLVAAARGGELARFRPRRRFLALLDTGDGRAILAYGRLALWSRWAARLKERIDRRFVRRSRRPVG
ncbi:MAG TPA: pyridine nucleotide-disulfide oxidoreductase, partial [Thermoanaerobaculia bacterium]|nr:pyridine nucleotide-disulfide oxidoreductase [Thermoanaerobaculia bacterium]